MFNWHLEQRPLVRQQCHLAVIFLLSCTCALNVTRIFWNVEDETNSTYPGVSYWDLMVYYPKWKVLILCGAGTRLCKCLIRHWKMLWIFYRIPALRFSETFLRTTKFDITRNYESSSVDCEERLWPPVVGRKSDRLTRRLRALLLAEKTWEEEHPQKKKKPRGENKSTLRMRAGNTIFYRSQVTVVRNSCRGDLCLAEKVKKQHVQTYWRRTYSLLCTLGPKSANDRLHQPVNQVPHHVTYFINQYLLMENDVI